MHACDPNDARGANFQMHGLKCLNIAPICSYCFGKSRFFLTICGMIRRAPHNINRCSITSLCACMVSCFRQSGSAPSLENPFAIEAVEFSFDIIHQFPNFCPLDPENLTESLELIRETAREASRETWPWMWCAHETHWHLSCAYKNHKHQFETITNT